MINLRIADMTNVWENVISHLEGLGYDRDLQILPDLYDYIEETEGKIIIDNRGDGADAFSEDESWWEAHQKPGS
jgi:hypothetical protein